MIVCAVFGLTGLTIVQILWLRNAISVKEQRFDNSVRESLYEIANSVQEALELLEMRLPDLILLDLVMPNTNGLDLASMLRSKDAWASIPIVALSADTRPETKISALTAGANCFLPKPFTIDELRIIIQPFLLEKSCNRASDTEAG